MDIFFLISFPCMIWDVLLGFCLLKKVSLWTHMLLFNLHQSLQFFFFFFKIFSINFVQQIVSFFSMIQWLCFEVRSCVCVWFCKASCYVSLLRFSGSTYIQYYIFLRYVTCLAHHTTELFMHLFFLRYSHVLSFDTVRFQLLRI